MGNFQSAIDATNESLNSAGATERQNAIYMESLSAKLNNLKAQFQELVLGDGGLNSFLKGLVDLGTGILKFANSDVGQTIIKLTALYVAITLASKGFNLLSSKAIPALMSGFGSLITSIVSATSVTEAFSFVLNALNINPVVLAISALILVFGALYKYEKEQKEKLDELRNSLSEYSNERDSLAKKEALTQEEKDRLEYLNKRIELTQQLIDKEDKLANTKQGTTASGINVNYPTTSKAYGVMAGIDYNTKPKDSTGIVEEVDEIQQKIDAYKELREEIENYNDASTKGIEVLDEKQEKSEQELESLIQLRDSLVEQKDAQEEWTEADQKHLDSLNATINTTNEATEVNKSYAQTVEDYGETSEETDEKLKELADTLGESTDEIQANAEAMGLSIDEYANYKETANEISDEMKNVNNSIDGLQSALSTAQKAQEEYSESGALTLDTFQQLLSISPQYLSALTNENGQIEINQNSLDRLVDSLKVAKIEELQNAAAHDILALANGNVAEMSETAKTAIQGVGNNAQTAGNQAGEASAKMAGFASSIWAVVKASKGEELSSDKKFLDQANAIINSYKGIAKSLTEVTVNTKSNTSATKSNTGAKKANKNATDEQTNALKKQKEALESQKEALEKEKSKYESVISYIEGKVEDYISTLEKEKDTEISSIEAQIKSLENLSDAETERIETKIKELEKLQKAEEETYDKDIDDIEELADTEKEEIETRISELEKQRDLEDELLDNQIASLKERKEKESEYWQEKIDALKAQNDAIEDQINLQTLLDNLAKAKETKKKVYREGQGFVYEEDSEAVSKAQQELQDYYRKKQYEEQLKELEDFKDNAEKNYDQQIKDLQELQESKKESYNKQIKDLKEFSESSQKEYEEQVKSLKKKKELMQSEYEQQIADLQQYEEDSKAEYDQQIQDLNDYKDSVGTNYNNIIGYYEDWLEAFKKNVGSYETEQNRLNALELTGIDWENSNWTTRLTNLQTFVNGYTQLQQQLATVQAQIEATTSAINSASSSVSTSGGGSSSDGGSGSSSSNKKYHVLDQYGNVKASFDTREEATAYIEDEKKKAKFRGNASYVDGWTTKYYAKGSYGVDSDQIAIVGDNPNSNELAIGSKLNNGNLMSLQRGTGIIPHNLTSTLVQMASAFKNSNTNLIPNNTNNSQNITIGNISLPNISNGKEFVDYLQNFSIDMTQKAFSRT